MTIVRQLEEQLDNEGIQVLIAEDIREPGVQVKHKLESKIRESNIVVALFTEDGINSEWVIYETNYAKQINKLIIPLREESVSIQSDVEWIPYLGLHMISLIFLLSSFLSSIGSNFQKSLLFVE